MPCYFLLALLVFRAAVFNTAIHSTGTSYHSKLASDQVGKLTALYARRENPRLTNWENYNDDGYTTDNSLRDICHS